jgi:predicted metalloprotease with PDZ domain
MKYLILAMLWMVLASPNSHAQSNLASTHPQKNQHSYTVRIDAQKNRAHVEADLQLEGNQLSLFNVNPMPGFPNGQADFLENIQVKDKNGASIKLINKGEGDYELASPGNHPIHLSYEVRLEHDNLNWPAGNEEILYHTDEGIMMTGYALFLVPAEKMSGATQVEFILPNGWHANTAMQSIHNSKRSEHKNSFLAQSRRELVNNAMFFGSAQSTQFQAGGIQLSLVLGKRYWPQRQLFEDLLRQQLQVYLPMFGAKPLAARYLIIINQGDSGDGGAFSGSFSQFLRGDAELRTRPIWGRVLAHELLHFWNGLSLVPENDQEEWFKEGVTDYLTITSMSHNHLINHAYVKQWLENLSRGQMVARRAQGIQGSVRDAAKNKHQNWLLVYGGGSIAGLALDIELRRASAEKVSLSQLMQILYRDFALQGRKYQLNDIALAAQQLTGKDFHPILQNLVENQNALDLSPLFSALGLQLEQYLLLEHSLLKNPQAKAIENARFKAIFGFDFGK